MFFSLSSRPFAAVVVAVSAVLVLGQTPADAFAAPEAVVKASAPKVDWTRPDPKVKRAVKPDRISAMVAARATGKQVEDESARTETVQVFANPDGTWATETAASPERARDEQGTWRALDPTLKETEDGGWSPKSSGAEITFSGGGDRTFATLTKDGRTTTWGWPGVLPEPVVDGASATYEGVAAGGSGDLVVTATRLGFKHDVVLRERPTEPLRISIPVRVSEDGARGKSGGKSGGKSTGKAAGKAGSAGRGKVVRSKASGRLVFQDARGTEVASAGAPLMWDAATSEEGDVEEQLPVATEVVPGADGSSTLTLTPDAEFLADPETEYPVTIDPSYTIYQQVDTWIQNAGYSGSQYTSTELRAGTYDSGAHIARSFVKFSTSKISGQHVLSATFRMRNYHSYSCTGSAVRVNRITESWNSNTVTWANQPAVTATDQVDYSSAHGYSSSCAEGYASWNVTPIVDKWAQGTATNNGLRVRGVSETNNNTWRKYRSGDYSSSSSATPQLIVVTNAYPNTPTIPTAAPVASYAAPGSSTSSLYTADTTPSFTTKASDPTSTDKVRIKYEVHNSTTVSASSKVAECTTAYVASGSNATCSLPSGTPLPDNDSYFTRARAYDGTDWSKNWSSFRGFRVGAATPAAPSISCPEPYGDGSWADDAPASDVTCTVTATGTGNNAPGYIRVAVDGGAEKQVKITPSSDPAVAKATVTVPKTEGGHKVTARAETPAGTLSTTASHGFGYGTASILSPAVDPVPTTTGKLKLSVEGPPKTGSAMPTASFKWRLAGTTADAATGWNTVPEGAVTGASVADADGKTTVSPTIDTTQLTRDDAAGIDLNDRVPTRIELQVCLTYDGGATQCTWTNNKLTVLRVPHAFGDGFPTADAGPGQVALWTGEFNTSETDVSVPGYTGDLSISRSHSTFAGEDTVAAGVFGPGWSAQLDGPDAGLGGLQVFDNTDIDGSLALVDDDGSALVYAAPAGRRTGANLQAADYLPADEDTALSGIELSVSGSGSSTVLTLTEEDGTVTTFKATKAPGTGAGAVFAPATVAEPGIAGSNQFVADASGRITQIIATAPPGVTCTPTGAATTRGCRSLAITYGTTTSGTEVAGQVKSISMRLWNPDKSGGAGMDSIVVATYEYDSAKRLTKVTDPRSGLSTSYTYNGSSDDLASVTPAGLKPFVLTFGSGNKLTKVTRERPDSGTATLGSYVYDVPLSTSGLPAVGADDVAKWNQAKAPTYAAAVFDAAQPADLSSITEAEWRDADLQFADAEGYTVNTASYGAGGWQLDATDYDGSGNVVRQLDERAIRAILDESLPAGATADQLASRTAYNADITDGDGTVLTPAGTFVVDEFSPARMVAESGGVELRQTHTHTAYDEGAPNDGINPTSGQPYRLPTTVTVSAYDPGAEADTETMSVTRTGYAKNTSGSEATDFYWNLGLATSTTTQLGASPDSNADITASTKYDAEGKVVATLQPKSNGTDAGTTRTTYYTADGSASIAACGNRPEWAGLVCETGPAAPPTSGPTLPTARTTAYTALLAPATVVETSGATTRTSRTTYLADGRTSKTWTTVAGLTGSTAVPGSETEYDTATGLPVKVHQLDSSQARTGTPATTGYDSWGRATSYTPVAGETTTTAYDSLGRVAKVTDPQGTTTWTYDGTDAAGNDEHRGLATKVAFSVPARGDAEITGAFDAGGLMTRQDLPGGVVQRLTADTAGEPTGLTYSGQVTTVDPETGESTTNADSPWLGWAQDNDALGRVAHEWTPVGSAFTDGDAGTNDTGDAVGYDRAYTYDQAARLTKVEDRTAATTGIDVTETAPACQVRTYGFDRNGNRTSLTRRDPAGDGSCATTGGTTTATVYDDADRITGGYVYDTLGRATTLPAASTPNGAATGDLAIGYHDDDAVKTLTQDGQTTSYTRDVTGRRAVETTGPTGGSATRTVARHYTDQSDNPGWIETTTGGSTTVTRYLEALAGDLAIEIDGSGDVTLPVADLHGDIVTTIEVPGTGAATAIDGWADTDEYGNPLADATAGVGGVLGYGWLGSKQRVTDPSSGLVLMGARLYNRISGQFTSLDPVRGGNSTAYAYPQDPINEFDLDGQRRCRRWYCAVGRAVWKRRNGIARGIGYAAVGACIFASAGVCGVAAGAAFAASAGNRTYSFVSGRHYRSRRGWSKYTQGLAADAVTWRFQAVKSPRALRALPRHARWGRHATRYYHRGRRIMGQGASAAWIHWG